LFDGFGDEIAGVAREPPPMLSAADADECPDMRWFCGFDNRHALAASRAVVVGADRQTDEVIGGNKLPCVG
jgi:hypothetical protein